MSYIKDLLKRILPRRVISAVQAVRRELSRPRVRTFDEIYKSNYWKGSESISGPGSSIEQTETIRKELPLLFRRHGVRSVLDIPCGDFNWMSRVDLGGVDYIGADLVHDMIASNNARFSKAGHSFQVMDLRSGPLPKVDLIFCRDCLVHMSYADIWSALNTVALSESKYMLTTSFTNRTSNRDIRTGDWRPINLEAPPFNLPGVVEKINENCTEGNMTYRDKSLLLLNITALNHVLEHRGV
jgi:SAM-dependent methyltransferase